MTTTSDQSAELDDGMHVGARWPASINRSVSAGASLGMNPKGSTSDADGLHRVGRHKRIVRVVLTGAMARAAGFLPALGIAPIAVGALGAERFGVLMTVLSLVALLAVADLGVGGSLITGVSRAIGAGKLRRVRSLQANGLVVVSFMGLVLALFAAALPLSDAGALMFPMSEAAVQHEATDSLAVFGVMFALSLPLTLASKIQLGLQLGHVANRWQTAAGLINFAAGALACRAGWGVPWIVFGLLSGTLACGLINTLILLLRESPFRPRLRDVRAQMIRGLMRDSAFYLALQLIFLISYAFDTLIVARKIGAQDASTYALAERLFSVIAVAVSIVTTPLWAAYGEALGARDYVWARQCLRTSIRRITLVSVALACGLLVLFIPLMTMLGSGTLIAPLGVAAAMAIWRVIEAAGGALAAYLMAARAVQVLLVSGTVTAVVSLSSKTLALNHFGPAVLPVITIACFLTFSVLPCVVFIRRFNRLNEGGH